MPTTQKHYKSKHHKSKHRKSKNHDKPVLETVDAEYHKDFADLKEKLVDKLIQILGENKANGVFNNFKEELVKKGKISFREKQESFLAKH